MQFQFPGKQFCGRKGLLLACQIYQDLNARPRPKGQLGEGITSCLLPKVSIHKVSLQIYHGVRHFLFKTFVTLLRKIEGNKKTSWTFDGFAKYIDSLLAALTMAASPSQSISLSLSFFPPLSFLSLQKPLQS